MKLNKIFSIFMIFLFCIVAVLADSITPNPAYSNNDLVCNIDQGADVYKWFKNGQQFNLNNDRVLEASYTSVFDNWKCEGWSLATTSVIMIGGTPVVVNNPAALRGSAEITISNALPIVNANGSYAGIEGQDVNFIGDASDPVDNDQIIAWSWDFGDGSALDTNQNATHIYAQNGTYTVTLTVTDSHNGQSTATTTVDIADTVPDVNFSISTNPVDEGVSVDLTDLSTAYDGIAAWEWDIDNDGVVDYYTQNATHTYMQNGTYTINLTVIDNDGSAVSMTQTIDVNDLAPTAILNANATIINESESVEFTDLSTSPVDDITAWSWDIDGDGLEDYNTQNVTHTYMFNGTYNVTLTVTDEDGSTNMSDITIIVVNDLGPTADFSISINPVDEGTVVDLTDLSVSYPDSIATWEWDIDNDGVVDYYTQNATHIYNCSNTDSTCIYTINLTVIDNDDSSDSITYDIVVNDLMPIAIALANTTSITEGESVEFTDISTSVFDSIDAWLWDFGDGNNSNQQNTTHTYMQNSTYYVTLTVTDSDGSTNTSNSLVIVVNDTVPTANFSVSSNNVYINETIIFTDISIQAVDEITNWTWDFGDGSPLDTNQNTTYAYTSPGTYTVNLTIIDSDGSESSATQMINVGTLESPNITSATPVSPVNINVTQSVDFNITAEDPEGSDLIVNWTVDGTELFTETILNGSSSNFTYQFNTNGTFIVTVTVTDNQSLQDVETWTVNVVNTTVADITPPTFNPVPVDQYIPVNGSLYYNINATDNVDPWYDLVWTVNDTVNFDITYAGILTNITPLNTARNYSLNITVMDKSGNSNSALITIYVYETANLAAPIFLNFPNSVVISNITNESATFNWETDIASDSAVFYDISLPPPFRFNITNSTPVTNHSVTLTGLNSNTTYFYYAASCNVINMNCSLVGNFNFTTVANGDITPPATIINLTNGTITNESITWIWTNPTDSDFAGTIIFINGNNTINLTSTQNSYTATGLMNNTAYTIGIQTFDTSNNVNTSTVTDTQTTLQNVISPTWMIINSTINGTFYNETNSIWPNIDNLTYIINSTISPESPTSNFTEDIVLINSNILYSSITNSWLTRVNSTNSTITGSILVDSQITRCYVKNVWLNNIVCIDSTLDPPTPPLNNLSGSTFINSTVFNSNVTNSNITNSNITDSNVDQSTITGGNIDDSKIDHATLNNVNATNSTITNTTISGVEFINATVQNGNLINGSVVVNGTQYNITNVTNYTGIIPVPPVSSFDMNPTTPYVNQAVTFTSTSTDGNNDIVSCGWNFGDGETATGCGSVTHTYGDTNQRTVTLTVTDSQGFSSQATRTFTPRTSSSTSSGSGGSSTSYTTNSGVLGIKPKTIYHDFFEQNPVRYTLYELDNVVFYHNNTKYSISVLDIFNDSVKLKLYPSYEEKVLEDGDIYDLKLDNNTQVKITIVDVTIDPVYIDGSNIVMNLYKEVIEQKEENKKEEPQVVEKVKDAVVKVKGETVPKEIQPSVTIGASISGATVLLGLLIFFVVRRIFG